MIAKALLILGILLFFALMAWGDRRLPPIHGPKR